MELEPHQKAILESVRRVSRQEIAPMAAEIDPAGEFRWDVAEKLGRLALLQIYLPPEFGGLETDPCRIGRQGDGFLVAMKDLDMSRPGIAGLALGIADAALEAAMAYACQRHTFGRRLIEHQAIGFMVADAATMIEAGRGLMVQAARQWDRGEKNTKLAAMAKYFCSDAAMEICGSAIQILGGCGYCRDFVERLFRDAKLTQIFEGANQIQRMIVGRELLRERGERSPSETPCPPA
jgi:alkylation response protein AidB-like acyl-CoA dehydrogenase